MIRSTHTFNFGKWKGFDVATVARHEPGYLYFCENELGYQFSPKVKRMAQQTSLRRRHFRRSGTVPAFV